jgi:hypothetical protein
MREGADQVLEAAGDDTPRVDLLAGVGGFD